MILITGGNGQLGTELRHLLDERGMAYTATDAKELDITDGVAVDKFFDENKPELVYHCAAYTAVDKAEDDADTCYRINRDAVSTYESRTHLHVIPFCCRTFVSLIKINI